MTLMQATASENAGSTWRISPRATNVSGYFAELWRYRRLFPFFAAHSVKQVYSAAIFGWGWLLIRPFIMALMASKVVGDILGVSTAPIPYVLFVLVSLSIWLLFQTSMKWGTKSIQRNRRLLHQFRFPPLIVHVTALGPAVVEFTVVVVSAAVAAIYFAIYGQTSIVIGWRSLAVVPAILMILLFVIGITCVTAVLNNMARDVWYTTRYVLSGWVLLTPVYYPLSAVPAPWKEYMLLNPLTPMVELFRWSILPAQEMYWHALALSGALTAILLLAGLIFFIKMAPRSLDVA